MATRQRSIVAGKPRVLIVSHDVVDTRMAGPGIRYWELARVLARHVPVTLAVPDQTTLVGEGFALQTFRRGDWETLRATVEGSDVLMPGGHTLTSFPALMDSQQPLIVDGYDPVLFEALARFAREPLERQEARQQAALALLRLQCLRGDFFICASERQRDWWLGLLEAYGRINPHTFAANRTLRQLVDVVPFGLPAQPPQHTRPVLKGVLPGIGLRDQVILWGGGIWEWLDPLTLLRAVDKVVRERPNVRLVFPGTQHPNIAAVPDMPMRQRAVESARELGLLNQYVFFGDWVDYVEWPNYLLEADVGVSLHFDTLETRLAFRTRVLNYIWAELPMVVTRGDAISEMVAQYGLGRIVDFEDVEGVAEAILALVDASPEEWHARFAEARAELTWERVAKPLVAFCENPHPAADRQDGRVPPSTADGLVEKLAGRLRHQEQQLERLRRLVNGYERGRFIRLMRFLNRVTLRMRSSGARDGKS